MFLELLTALAPVVGGIFSSGSKSQAAGNAAQSQIRGMGEAITEQQKAYEDIQKLLQPYLSAGSQALSGQLDLAGLSTPEQQAQRISALENSPFFQSMVKQGENAILANASAIGGLRGGDLRQSLSQFRPQLLNQLIEQQYSKFGQIGASGQNALNALTNARFNTGQNVSNLYTGQGTAMGQGQIAAGNAYSELAGLIPGVAGSLGAINWNK